MILLRFHAPLLGVLQHSVRLLLFHNCVGQVSELQLFDALEKFQSLVLLAEILLLVVDLARVVFFAPVD